MTEKIYLVQYGEYGKGMTLEAKNERNAVSKVIDSLHFFKKDLEHDFYVFEMPEGKTYSVSSSYEIEEIKNG